MLQNNFNFTSLFREQSIHLPLLVLGRSYGNFKSRRSVTLASVASGEIYKILQSSTSVEGGNTLEVTHDDDSAGRIPTKGRNDS